MKVLIVDDNHAAADLLQELLSLQDHASQCAYTAQEAIDASERQQFDCALIDLTLPDQPGTAVARHLRNQAVGRPLLLVAITGVSPHDAVAVEAGPLFDHFLQKPIDFHALDKILDALGHQPVA